MLKSLLSIMEHHLILKEQAKVKIGLKHHGIHPIHGQENLKVLEEGG